MFVKQDTLFARSNYLTFCTDNTYIAHQWNNPSIFASDTAIMVFADNIVEVTNKLQKTVNTIGKKSAL